MGEGGAGATGAGALLREAREKQGLHIAALAASIKIPPRKLEALENDRYDELPDATFTRALALAVCRALKIDAAPVLSHLPQLAGPGLSRVSGGLNEPFRDRGGRVETAEFAPWRHPLAWAAGLLGLLAVVVWLVPAAWWSQWWPRPAPTAATATATAPAAEAAPAASGVAASAAATTAMSVAASAANAAPATASTAAMPASAPTVEVVHAAPPAEAGASAAPPAGVAVLRVTEPSWVEVVDAGGQVLLQRTLQPGESVGLDGRLPMRVKVGNAAGTQISLRGQPVDLAAATRDNIARIELK